MTIAEDTTANVAAVTTGVDTPTPQVTTPDEALPPEPPEEARELVFEIRDLEVRYSGHTAVREVDLDIAANEITAFIGPSGCGKTTVLRVLNRMHDITPGAKVFGRVTYHGEDLYSSKVDSAEVRRRIGMVFQKPNPFPKTIFDNVAYGPKINGRKRSEMADIVEHALDARRAVGRSEGQAEAQRPLALRWSAAAPVHRACDRGGARRRADGRAVLRPRPDRDRRASKTSWRSSSASSPS